MPKHDALRAIFILMVSFDRFADSCRRIRKDSPVIHNITNFVAMNFSANVLLAIGASPLMSSEPDEIEEIDSLASSLVINLGCLDSGQIRAMYIAASTMHSLGKPWVLDPVGAGISRLRSRTAEELISRYRPTVIRGNASEIMSLCGIKARTHGIDSAEDSLYASQYAVQLARDCGSIISISGETDIITDGGSIVRIYNGDRLMPSVTAMGCSASAVTAAFLAVGENPLQDATFAMALMGTAGERAAGSCAGTGSLAVKILDELSSTEPEVLAQSIRHGQESA